MGVEWSRHEFRDFVVRGIAYPAGLRMPRHDHSYANVTAVIRGEIVESTESAEHRGRSCSVVVKPAGTPHADRVVGPGPAVTVAVELRPGSELTRLTAAARWSWVDGAEAARAAFALQESICRHLEGDIERRAHELLATVLVPKAAADPPPWLSCLLQMIDQQGDQPLRFGEMARKLDLHASYVSRAFRRFTGRSMTDHVRDLRLRNVRHLLGSTKRPLSAIAAECGFTDASHLSRTFARVHGVNPGAYRQICNGRG